MLTTISIFLPTRELGNVALRSRAEKVPPTWPAREGSAKKAVGC